MGKFEKGTLVFRHMHHANGVSLLRAVNAGFLNLLDSNPLTQKIIDKAGGTYLAGHCLDEVLAYAEENWKRGWRSTIAVLGEDARTPKEATRYLSEYQRLAEGIEKRLGVDDAASISVKPTSLYAVTDFNNISYDDVSHASATMRALVE